ncbi:MAG: hypothetical protein JXR59_05200 [Desulfuromonadaceae bacterium]|nr:hypothetical protein [Desulfuromonadaceae bacterium]
MTKKMILIAMLLALATGCEKKQEVAETPTPAKEQPAPVTQQVETAVKEVTTQVKQVVEKGEQAVTQMATEIVQQVAAVPDAVVEQGKQVVAEAKQNLVQEGQKALAELAAPVTQPASEPGGSGNALTALATGAVATLAQPQKEEAATEGGTAQQTVNALVSGLLSPAAAQTASPAILVLENSYGAVTFPHAVHGKELGCTPCHGESAPAAFELGKDKAHALCKGCHKDKSRGPTNCAGCHKK